MKKIILPLAVLFFLIPISFADECGITNLGTCISENFFQYIVNIINAPLQPLLKLIYSLHTEPIALSLFKPFWAIMLYIISIFYGLLMLYSGFKFMISGYDAAKRENAKEWFRNIFIMIVLVQASFFIYQAIIELSALLTAGVINLVDPNFFKLTADNIPNIGLQFFFAISYVIALLVNVFMLTIRYIIVATGVILTPLAIFLYFIPPLKSYGKLIFNFLGICIFITFIDAIVFLICSKLIEIPLFANFKILVMIASFTISNFLIFYLMMFTIIRAVFNSGEDMSGKIASIKTAVKYLI